MAADYWGERAAKAQAKLTTKSIKETQKQLAKYYKVTMLKSVGQFELIHKRVLASIRDGATPTPADLYKLDTYWKMQGQLNAELRKLGELQLEFFNKEFTEHYINIYQSLALMDNTGAFSTVDANMANQIINAIWCADGKSWSARIWENTERLQEALNNGLSECLLMGKKSDWLTQRLTEEFNVSFHRAESLVKTELSHIQNQAAQQRYADLGVKQFQVWAEKDERQCKVCGKLHETRYPIGAKVPIPAHPRCRCTIIPVID